MQNNTEYCFNNTYISIFVVKERKKRQKEKRKKRKKDMGMIDSDLE